MDRDLILVKRGVLKMIEDKYGVCRQTAAKALRGDVTVKKYNFIRAVAINKYGGKK